MVIGILIRSHVAVVLVVLGEKFPVKVVGKQDRRDPASYMVCFFVAGNNAVHGIVCCDKEPGVQVCLHQNGQVGQGIFPGKFPGEPSGFVVLNVISVDAGASPVTRYLV